MSATSSIRFLRWAAAFVTLALALAGIPVAASAADSTATRPAVRSAATKPAAKRAAPAAARTPATRTLDEVHIAGELDVPEVLFITARDQRRIVGFQHRRYLASSAELARRTPLPTHVVVARRPAAEEAR